MQIAFAQQKNQLAPPNNDAKYRTNPVWIGMMENPNTNYYEACKAFNLYWEGKIVPAETEGEAMDLGKEENIKGREKEEESEEKIPQSSQQYVYEYKQFMHWRLTMKNMIDVETGRIMSIDEVQEILRKERSKK